MPAAYLDVTDASPRLTLPQAPAYNQFTGRARVFIDAYEDWAELIILSGASDKIIGIEADAAGNVYVHSQNIGSPGYLASNLITGSYRGWMDVAVTSDGTNVIGYGKILQPNAALVTATRAFSSDIAPTLLEFGGASVFGTDSEGKHAFELVAAWPFALSASDIAREFASRKREPVTPGAFFWNDCRNGFDITRNMARAPRQGFGGPAVRTGVITTVPLTSGAVAPGTPLEVFSAGGGTAHTADINETVTLSAETIALHWVAAVTLPETVALSGETVALAWVARAPLTETITLSSETIAARYNTAVPLVETITVNETSLASKGNPAPLAETLTLSAENVVAIYNGKANLQETVALSEQVTNGQALTAPVSETVTLSAETITVRVNVAVPLAETIPLSNENIALHWEARVGLAETVPLVEQITVDGVAGAGSDEDEWHPDWYRQGWVPDYQGEPS